MSALQPILVQLQSGTKVGNGGHLVLTLKSATRGPTEAEVVPATTWELPDSPAVEAWGGVRATVVSG